MQELVLNILKVLGSLGLFIYGMKVTSETLQRLAGDWISKHLQKSNKGNLFRSIINGTYLNGLIQSSTTSSAMTISLVNSGLLKLRQAMGVIMGINIGTSVTTWLIAMVGFKFILSNFSVLFIGLCFPFLFSKKEHLKNLAEFAIGIGILLLGAEFLKEMLPIINSQYDVLNKMPLILKDGYFSIILFLFLGFIVTYTLQSASGVMAIAVIFLSQGWLSLLATCALCLGENLAISLYTFNISKSGNIHAKRAALFHNIFNVSGTIIFTIFLPLVLLFVSNIVLSLAKLFPINDANKIIMSLPLFHVIFCISHTIIFSFFLTVIEAYLLRKYPTTGKGDEDFHLRFINTSLLATPELALLEAKKELQTFAKIIEQMGFAFSKLLFDKNGNTDLIVQKLMQREEQTDDIELEIANYLTKLSESELSAESSQKIRSMLSIANNLERVADIYYQMTKNYQRMAKMNLRFPEDSLHEIKEMLDLLLTATRQMRENLELETERVKLQESYDVELKINQKRKDYTNNNFDRLERNIYDPRAGVIYMDYISRIERIGDHLINVSEALVSTQGFIVKKV